jgi:transcriptional regulator with XRE-family HTH domain
MQRAGHRSQALNDVKATFAERAKAARLRAGLTQQQLSYRLETEADVSLDTSGITRIESGQREPRLGEALALARVLDFGLDNLVPRADLDFYITDLKRLMDESRAALVKMLQSVDPALEFVRRNPDSLIDGRLEELFSEVIERFRERISAENFDEVQPAEKFAITTSRADEKLKRQLLRAVSERILVRPDEIPTTYDRWFSEDLGEQRRGPRGVPRSGKASRRPPRVESRVRAVQWENHFSQLRDYVRRHGDAQVPRAFVTPGGDPLGAWVVDQRKRFKQAMLDSERSMRLEELPGWTWSPQPQQATTKTTTPQEK